MLQIFRIHKLETTQEGPEVNIFGYKCNGVGMVGDTYSLNTTLCWVHVVYVMYYCTDVIQYTLMVQAIYLKAKVLHIYRVSKKCNSLHNWLFWKMYNSICQFELTWL